MRRRTLAVTGAVALVIGGISTAQAVVHAIGHGSGRAHVIGRHDILDVRVTGDAVDDLEPGAATRLQGAFSNPNRFALQVHRIQVGIKEIVGAPGPCAASDFELVDAVKSPPWVLAAGHGASDPEVTAWQGGSITLINDATHQVDGCLGATVKLKFTIAS